MPQIELKIFSFDKQTYHSKEDIDDIYEMTGTLQEIILDNLKMLKEKDVLFDHGQISNLNEVGSKINEHSRDILEILGSFEKKEQQGEEETEKALQPES
jgi:predicted transcriptional regulator